jgi:AraC family transcriptional regulator
VIEGATVEVRTFEWRSAASHSFQSPDYVITRLIKRSAGSDLIRTHLGSPLDIPRSGAVSIIPPDTTVTLEAQPGEATFISCLFSRQDFEGAVEVEQWTEELTSRVISLSSPFMAALLEHMANEILSPRPNSQRLFIALLGSLTAEVASIMQVIIGGGLASPVSRKVELLKRLIEQAAAQNEPAGLAKLAESCSLSVRQMMRIFKKHTGTTIHGYFRLARLEKAKALLASHKQSITEIASTCGFTTKSHFSAEFRSLMGHSPKVFRETSQKSLG